MKQLTLTQSARSTADQALTQLVLSPDDQAQLVLQEACARCGQDNDPNYVWFTDEDGITYISGPTTNCIASTDPAVALLIDTYHALLGHPRATYKLPELTEERRTIVRLLHCAADLHQRLRRRLSRK